MKRLIILSSVIMALPFFAFGQGQDARYNYLSAEINKYQKQNDFVQANRYHAMAIAHFDSIEIQMLQMGVPNGDSLFATIKTIIKGHRDLMTVNDIELDFNKYNYKKEEDKSVDELKYEIECKKRMLLHLDTASSFLQFRIPLEKNIVATKEIHIVTILLASERYKDAEVYIGEALRMAQPGSRPYYESNNWAGHLYYKEAREISNNISQLQEAVTLYEYAESYFSIANKPDRVLDSRLQKSMCLKDLNRRNEAKQLLEDIVASGKRNDTLSMYTCEASFWLGQMAREEDRYDDAIRLLEEGYSLSRNCNFMQMAMMSANEMVNLYTKHIPNEKMRSLWQLRSEECKAVFEAQTMERERILSESKHRYEHKQSDNKLAIITRLTKGMELAAAGRYKESIDSITALAKELEQADDGMVDILADCYSSLCNAKLKLKDYSGAAADGRRALSLMNQTSENSKKGKASIWYRMTVICQNIGKSQDALEAADSCVAATENYYGLHHTETLDAYDLRANVAAMGGEKERALNDMAHCFEIVRNNVLQNFAYLTTTERTTYWKRFSGIMRKMAVFADGLSDFESEYTDALYEEQLLAKGLLLTAESELRRAISDDVELKNAYERIRTLRKWFLDPQTPPTEAEKALTEADRIERQLGTQAGSLHQFMDFLKVGVKDVKMHLPTGCAAVEFVDYPGREDRTKIGALILLPDKPHTHLIPLAYESELLQQQEKMGSLVWQPILDYVGSTIHDIYFAPTAILYQLPIESVKLENVEYVETSSRRLHRVSSTRWLALHNENSEGHDAVIYGGLRYDATVAQMSENAKRYEKSSSNMELLAMNEGKRAALTELIYLKGTLEEADSIANTLKSKMNILTLSGVDGTEASFKALSGQQKRVIHIGTHGFYDDASHVADLESALDRSGLFFAGADNKRFGEEIPAGVEDGVLTAREIEELDLRGLDLITLSACETGQGAVSGDGVFGLQRGFKKAGAKSILMSLWKVNDEATCVLMSEFYRNWTNDTNMHDALEIAKRKVRETKGWEDPQFWASFILLDAN